MRPDLTTDDINLALSAVGMVLNMTTAPNEAGTVAALLVRDPFRIGYEGVKTALAAAKGEQVPPTIDIGTSVITKAISAVSTFT